MKHRAPRKKKKQAKKLKAAHDISIMVRTQIIAAQSTAQVAIIAASPAAAPAFKALKVASVMIGTARWIQASLSEIKHWTSFVPNYRSL